MVGLFDELLEVYCVVAKRRQRLGAGGIIGLLHLVVAVYEAHALAPASHRCLEHHGVTYFPADAQSLVGAAQRLGGSGHHRHAGGHHALPCGNFVAHFLHGLGGGADEDDALGVTTAHKVGVFRQEAVAGMYGVGLAMLGYGDNLFDVKITLVRLCRAYAIGFVGIHHVTGGAVHLREHSHRAQSHLTARAHDTYRYLATVGY